MRSLATIQKIADIQPIEGADAIEKVKINDWWCVAKKGEFKLDDFCIYFEIDSLLPSSNPAFQFLAKGNKERTMVVDGKEYVGYRLKTIRLRKQISQGLALPISMFGIQASDANVDGSVGEVLGIVKYEAPIPAQLAGKVKGSFPGFLRKTDEERVQNLGDLIKRMAGTLVYVTEKLDGSSVTIYKKDGVLGVCSRNWELQETEGNSIWKLVNQYDLKNTLPEGWALQGEIIGEGIQDNPLKIKGQEIFVFNLFDISAQKFQSLEKLEADVFALGMKTVPMINKALTLTGSVEEILALADGESLLYSGAKREGIVIRPVQELTVEIKGKPERFSFKAISNEYLLAEK